VKGPFLFERGIDEAGFVGNDCFAVIAEFLMALALKGEGVGEA
jgi:hypothetical protein